MQREFNLQFSTYLAVALLVSHGAALAVLAILTMPLWAKILLALLILVSFLYHLWHHALLFSRFSTKKLILEGDMVLLVASNGDQLLARVLTNSLVTPFITVLNVLPQGKHFARSIIIMPDTLDEESFRQLRVWLKWWI